MKSLIINKVVFPNLFVVVATALEITKGHTHSNYGSYISSHCVHWKLHTVINGDLIVIFKHILQRTKHLVVLKCFLIKETRNHIIAVAMRIPKKAKSH